MSDRWVFRGQGMVVVQQMGSEVVVTIDGIGREAEHPQDPMLAEQLDRFAPDLARIWGTAWSVADPAALVRVLDRLAVQGFERVDGPASLEPFAWPGAAVGRDWMPDLLAWRGRSLAAFVRRYGAPTADILVHSATSGFRSVSRRAFYSVHDVHFVVETDLYAVITLTGPKPHPTAAQLMIASRTVFPNAAALQVAIDRWPRDL